MLVKTAPDMLPININESREIHQLKNREQWIGDEGKECSMMMLTRCTPPIKRAHAGRLQVEEGNKTKRRGPPESRALPVSSSVCRSWVSSPWLDAPHLTL